MNVDTIRNLITDSLEYYDKCLIRNDTHDMVNFIKSMPYADAKKDILLMQNENNTDLLIYDAEIIAIVDFRNKILRHAWGEVTVKNNITQTSRRALMYGLDINDNMNPYATYLKKKLITPYVKVYKTLNIEITISILAYLMKCTNIYLYTSPKHVPDQPQLYYYLAVYKPCKENVQYVNTILKRNKAK
jgi:hypothetical protein